MSHNYPQDRFDRAPESLARVGSHREGGAARPRRRGLLIAAIATVVLIAAGIGLVIVLGLKTDFVAPAPSGGPVAAVEPTASPDVAVTVLNGTETGGLAATAAERLTAAGFAEDIATGNADDRDLPSSVVYFQDPGLEGAARGAAAALGIEAVEASEAPVPAEGEEPAAAEITVVLGADFIE